MKSILLVDDEPALLRSLAILLRREHYLVNEARSVADALDQIRKDPPDLVITDLLMEPLDGLDLLSLVQRTRPTCPVLVMTAYASPENRAEAKRLGVIDFLEKPLEGDRLLERIRSVVGP